MECTSDTESDTDTVAERPAFHDTNPNPDMGVPAFEAVRSAVECLSERDVASIIEDESYFQESSKPLLHFLDRVPRLLGTGHVPEVIQILSQLGTLLFLQRLLDIRRYLRRAKQVPGSNFLVITWIDVVLAKLGILVTPITVGLAAFDLEKEAEWIQLRREDDTIRAATQLPDSCKAMVAVIGTSSFSPAARRLATSLCFVAYIMVRQIVSDKTWPREGPPPLEILHSLYPSINQAACASVSPSALRGSSLDKIQLAMFVSLFADAHSHTEPGDITYTSHLRPEGFGRILEIIQVILGESNSSFRVLERPDAAQHILLQWGNVVPWSWTTWDDQRIANAECLRSLSATWFFLVQAPMETRHLPLDRRIFDIDLRCTLLSDVLSSSLMVLQLLKEFLDKKNWNFIPYTTAIRLLCKLCWATIQYLEANIFKRDPQFEDLIPQLCDSLILLFPVIEIHDGDENFVRFLIVEALALIPVNLILSSLKKLLQNKHFLSNLDESMRCCIMLLSDQCGQKRDQDIQNHFATSLMNFSSLLLQSAIDEPGLRRTISSFVANISQSMFRRANDRSLNTSILGPFLTLLSVLRIRKSENIKIKDEDIWSLTMQGLNQHLSVPAAFSYYLLSTAAHHRDSLLRHEAWNYLLGVLIRILERQLPEEDEALALLISPNICTALRSIPCNGITRECLLASPWALTMRLSMQELIDSINETQKKELYFKQLRERIRSEGLQLVNELFGATRADDVHPLAVTMPRLVYHRDCYKSELVPVYEVAALK